MQNSYFRGTLCHQIKVRPLTLIKPIFLFLIAVLLLFSIKSNAQSFNCPDANRCTSKDLEVVGAFLSANQCSCPTVGSPSATLVLKIVNKTGSLRTSFAFFATFERSLPGGTPIVTTLKGCTATIPSNSTLDYTFGTVQYACGERLRLINAYLAWTDASDGTKNDCTTILNNNCGKITPKCGTDNEIIIVPLLGATAAQQPSCEGGSTGGLTVTAVGGTPHHNDANGNPVFVYTYSIDGGAFQESNIFNNLTAGSHVIRVHDHTGCEYMFSSTVLSKACCVTPTISAHPSNQTKCVGEGVSFSVSSTGGTPAPSVSWETRPNSSPTWTPIVDQPGDNYTIVTSLTNGTTNSALSLTTVTSSMNGSQFRAVLTSGTCPTATSNAATLTVKESVTVSDLIDLSPKCPGENATYSSTAAGAGATGASIRWYKENTLLANGADYTIVVSGNQSTLTILNVDIADAGTYYARIGGAETTLCGTDDDNTSLVVRSNVAVSDPANETRCPGENAVFSSTASGTDATGADIRWYKDQTLLTDDAKYDITVNGNQSTLTILGVALADVGTYYAKIGGAGTTLCGTSENNATLTVNEGPVIPTVTLTEPSICGNGTGTLTITNALAGAVYTLTQDQGGKAAEQKTAASASLEFTGLVAGKKYYVTGNNAGCISAEANCSNNQGGQQLISSANDQSRIMENINPKIESNTTAKAAPNPFTDKIRFTLESDISGRGSLELYNMLGQKLSTIYEGYIQAGQKLIKEYNVPKSERTNVIYIFKIGGKQVTGKLIGIK